MVKIFVSYKYKDKNVYNHPDFWEYELTEDTDYQITARHYVNYLEELIWQEHIYKWEKDGESMAEFSDETIDTKLKGKIFDSSVTIVLLSKNMKENKSEKLQWIPQEIAYSLKEKTRNNRTSYTNGILLVALPDENNSYDYAFIKKWEVEYRKTNTFFNIIADNMFNNKEEDDTDNSYIFPVTWDDFIKEPNEYIDYVLKLKDKIDKFNLTKTLDNSISIPFSF